MLIRRLVAPSLEAARKLAKKLSPQGGRVEVIEVKDSDMVDVRVFLDGLRKSGRLKAPEGGGGAKADG